MMVLPGCARGSAGVRSGLDHGWGRALLAGVRRGRWRRLVFSFSSVEEAVGDCDSFSSVEEAAGDCNLFSSVEEAAKDCNSFSSVKVTRLKCGGFIFALRLNHTMSDAVGLVQFMTAVGEAARGARVPSILPVWAREAFNARNPPRVTCTHHEYDDVPDTDGTLIPLDDMAHRSFFFRPTEISAIRRFLPDHLRKCSTFEILTAALWRCRTISLEPKDPEQEVRVICVVNARSKIVNPPLPTGFYGNALAYPMALTTAAKLCKNPLGFALELVRSAKAYVTEEYMQSLADLMVIRGRPHFTKVGTYLVSDVTRAGFGDVDFGWGKAAYGGPAKGGVGMVSFYIPFRDNNGEVGIVVTVCLPAPAMERFVKELGGMLKENPIDLPAQTSTTFVKCAL